MNIAVIGSITRDRIIISKRVEEFSQPGGGIYYCSLALACLGVRVTALPLLSREDADLLDALNHPRIKVFPQWTAETTVYQNTYPEESLDMCEKKLISSVKNFGLDDSVLEKIVECDAIHLVPLSSEEYSPSLFPNLRKNFERTISIDGQGFTKGAVTDLRSVLENNVDIIKLDDSEAREITATSDEQSAINTFITWGISEILITKASKGSCLHYNGQTHSIPAYKQDKIIDATGCGDTYISGYLAKRLAGHEPLQSAHFASKIAAKSLEFKGALTVPGTGYLTTHDFEVARKGHCLPTKA